MTNKKEIAQLLLDNQAVILQAKNQFTWSSGIKSPIYCDNRKLISYPDARKQVVEGLVDLIKEKYPQVTAIAGTATAGIPHAAWVSERLNLPMIYVRGKAKAHGTSKQIEGALRSNDKVVVIEDLISTGGSVLQACQVLEQECDVLGIAGIFSYKLKIAEENFKREDITYHVLSDFPTLLNLVKDNGKTDSDDLEVVEKWYQNFKESK